MKRYRGYSTHDLSEAVSRYQKTTGTEPTVLVVRPDFDVIGSHAGLVRSPHGAWGMILASHLLTKREIATLAKRKGAIRQRDIRPEVVHLNTSHQMPPTQQSRAANPMKSESGYCPHCRQEVIDFNALGWWWGWSEGKNPPYWEELRLFIFRRDGYKCQKCGKACSAMQLECHHVIQKEQGGIDGARNLTSLCKDCHLDTKPIMPDERD